MRSQFSILNGFFMKGSEFSFDDNDIMYFEKSDLDTEILV